MLHCLHTTVEPCLTVMLLLQSLFSGQNKRSASHFLILKSPFNVANSLMRQDFFDPLVARLIGLHCNTNQKLQCKQK